MKEGSNVSGEKVALVTGAGSGIGRAIAEALAGAGHRVFGGLRPGADAGDARAGSPRPRAAPEGAAIRAVEMDVLSDEGCRAAVDQVLVEAARLDVLVNNAGMLMTGIAEAFTPDQFVEILATNAVSWLRVNRAAPPAMRREGRGVLVYVGSTTARLAEPFLGVYSASKAAGEALAEVMAFEVSRFGIESVFTRGTRHFAHAKGPANADIVAA